VRAKGEREWFAPARQARRRNAAIAMALACLVLLVYALTIAKLGLGVLIRPL
jgi:hypothetical protein